MKRSNWLIAAGVIAIFWWKPWIVFYIGGGLLVVGMGLVFTLDRIWRWHQARHDEHLEESVIERLRKANPWT